MELVHQTSRTTLQIYASCSRKPDKPPPFLAAETWRWSHLDSFLRVHAFAGFEKGLCDYLQHFMMLFTGGNRLYSILTAALTRATEIVCYCPNRPHSWFFCSGSLNETRIQQLTWVETARTYGTLFMDT